MQESKTRRRISRGHIFIEGSVYFVTWRLARQQVQLSSDERAEVVSAIRHFANERYQLFAYVVMNDHVHVLLSPNDAVSLLSIVQSWKSFTANLFQRKHGRRGALWQRSFFEHAVRNDEDLNTKAEYIVNNPAKRWPGVENYPWVWAASD
jgi:REP element-mobilizing transposase RayT